MKLRLTLVLLMVLGLTMESFAENKSEVEWITPTRSTCENNGGKINNKYCEAKEQDAKAICRASNGRLPTIDELKKIVIDCGGIIAKNEVPEIADKNFANKSYRQCYKDYGFGYQDYWSSTKVVGSEKHNSWVLIFGVGFMLDNKNGKGYHEDSVTVRCIRLKESEPDTISKRDKASIKSNNIKTEQKIIIGAGVRLREDIEKTKKVGTTAFGTIGSMLEQSKNKKGEVFYKIETNSINNTKIKGWISEKYLYPYNKQNKDKIFLKIATDKYNSSKLDFGNLVEISNFLESISDDDLSTREKLKALDKKVIESILKLIEKNHDNPLYQLWLDEHEDLFEKRKGDTKSYKESSNQKSAEALFNQGLMYYGGIGVKKDYKKAIKFYQRAANKGYAEAQVMLGAMYVEGNIVKRDYHKAIEFYEKAAKQGNADALSNLGNMYAQGRGVKQDYQKAVNYFEKAANKGVVEAQFNLGVMYQDGLEVEQNYQKAANYFEKAANKGYAEAQYELGVLYMEGKGVEQNDKKTVELYQKAANQGLAKALFGLGVRYDLGEGIEKDEQKAIRFFEKAANHGSKEAKSLLEIKCIVDPDICVGSLRKYNPKDPSYRWQDW